MNRGLSVFLASGVILGVASMAAAQPTAVVKVLGVSPRDVAADTMDIFTRASTGLANVGVGEIVYLIGNYGAENITAWEWSLARPNGSNSELNATDDAVVFFVPDMVGSFRVTLTVTDTAGVDSEPVTYPINSANFVGVGGIVGDPEIPQCAACHAGQIDQKVEPWQGTGHATQFTRGIDGILGARYSSRCISCHTVGFDENELAVNGGFDDIAREEEWVFPDTVIAGNWDDMVENYPATAAMANIQCESCHGPGSAHRGITADNKMVASLESDVCAKCHDSGSHHTRPYQWDSSKHANVTRYPSGPGRNSCVRCHTGYGFVDYLNGVPQEEARTDYIPITCATCHDPHDAANEHQLRTVAAYTLENGEEVDYGYGNLCVTCHHSRRNAEEYATEYHSHYGPHYSNQGDMLAGTNAIDYDRNIPSTPHLALVENKCVGCHMAEGPDEDEPGYLTLGDHSFAMVNADGVEHVETCATCHGEIESFGAIMAGEDWDGDDEVESAMMEIEGMMHRLAMILPPVGEPEVVVTDAYTGPQLLAAYNYLFVEEDGSHGMHNPTYARGLLQAAWDDRENLGVEIVDQNSPYEYTLGAAYPNPFNPSTRFDYSLAADGKVSIKVFDLTGREVMTVVNSEHKAGAYRTSLQMDGYNSGVYIVRMVSGGFIAAQKLTLVK